MKYVIEEVTEYYDAVDDWFNHYLRNTAVGGDPLWNKAAYEGPYTYFEVII